MTNKYPGIAGGRFESRTDRNGKAVHAARLAIEAGEVSDPDLLQAMDKLEAIVNFAGIHSPEQPAVFRAFESPIFVLWSNLRTAGSLQ